MLSRPGQLCSSSLWLHPPATNSTPSQSGKTQATTKAEFKGLTGAWSPMGQTSVPRYLNWATPYLLSLGLVRLRREEGEIHHPGPVGTSLSELLVRSCQTGSLKRKGLPRKNATSRLGLPTSTAGLVVTTIPWRSLRAGEPKSFVATLLLPPVGPQEWRGHRKLLHAEPLVPTVCRTLWKAALSVQVHSRTGESTQDFGGPASHHRVQAGCSPDNSGG